MARVETVQAEAVGVVTAADETALLAATVGDGEEVLVERVIVAVIVVVCSTTAVSIESWVELPVEVTIHGLVVNFSIAAYPMLLTAAVAVTDLNKVHRRLIGLKLTAAHNPLYTLQ